MDAETERQLAAIVMEEASRLRIAAERDGVAAYLVKPKVRSRANPRFLQATVRSIQQSNKIVEVNEMWRRRNVEIEMEHRTKRRWRSEDANDRTSDNDQDSSDQPRHANLSDSEGIGDDGLKDDELEQFLHSRIKRGRGAVGSRMDETGPYLPPQNEIEFKRWTPDERAKCKWEERIVGPFVEDKVRDWDCENWRRKARDCKMDERTDKELYRSSKIRKDSRHKKERHSKKKKRLSEKSSKRKG